MYSHASWCFVQSPGGTGASEISRPTNGDAVNLKSMVASLKRKADKQSKRLPLSTVAKQLDGKKKKKTRLSA